MVEPHGYTLASPLLGHNGTFVTAGETEVLRGAQGETCERQGKRNDRRRPEVLSEDLGYQHLAANCILRLFAACHTQVLAVLDEASQRSGGSLRV